MNREKQNKYYGQSFIELLVTIGLAAILLPALFTGFLTSRQGKAQETQRLQALASLKEAQEATRSVRDNGWDTFAVNGIFHPVVSGSSWSLVTGSENVSGFTREIVISDVYRDVNGNIITTGGTIDPSTKKVVSTVSWQTPLPTSVSATEYVARYKTQAYTETTNAQFNSGTKSGVIVTNTSGGEVTLGAGGRGADWCAPNLSIAALDLPKNGVANAITAIEGRVFAGTGDNASGVSFANVTVSNSYPPVAAVAGTFDGYKTNGVFGETNYAYLATDTNSKEVEIINISQTPYSEAGYFNAPGNGSGNSVFVSGNTGYMTDGSKLYNFDLSSKVGSRPIIDPDGVGLAGVGNKVVVVGNYAYIAIESTTTQLQIVDISSSNNLTVVGQASVAGQVGKDVFVNSSGTRAYLATAQSATQKELFILDVSTKTGNRPTIGSYEANGMSPKGITVVSNNRAILVGTSGEEYQAINISDETSPTRCGGLNIDTGVNGVASVLEADGDAYSYIITGDASSELKIIEGGAGGAFSSSGTFESQTFDATQEAAFNSFTVTAVKPVSTTLTYQVGISHAVNGSCNGAVFLYIGPDGTGNTNFATGSALPLLTSGAYVNPGRCLRYKAFLNTTDNTQSPILNDITFNYSP